MEQPKKKKRFRKVRLRTIFLLAITLASNSFAWFIYTTKVSSNITAKVREWNVTFDINGQSVEKTIEINNKKHDYFAIFVLFDSIYTDFNRKIAFMT